VRGVVKRVSKLSFVDRLLTRKYLAPPTAIASSGMRWGGYHVDNRGKGRELLDFRLQRF